MRSFIERTGVAKVNSTAEYGFLEHCLREDLNATAQRVMGVLRPVKLVLTNYPEGQTEKFTVENNPENPGDGSREVSFSRELYIESDDFMETPVPKYNACTRATKCGSRARTSFAARAAKKDENGNVTEVYAECDLESRGGNAPDGRKVRGTIHWVDACNCLDAEVRLYGNLFTDPDPDASGKDFIACLNPASLEVLTGCKVERCLKTAGRATTGSSCAWATSAWTAATAPPGVWSLTVPSR